MLTIDVHHHVGPQPTEAGHGAGPEDLAALDRDLDVEYDIPRRLALMDFNRVDRAVVSPSPTYPLADGIAATRRQNDRMALYKRRHPDRFTYANGILEPSHGSKCLEELDRIHFELGLDGVMWHHRFQGAYIDHPIMRPILRKMAEYKMVPFVHTYADRTLESPVRLQALASAFPDLVFIAMDPFSTYEQAQELFQIARLAPNILFDTNFMILPVFAVQFVREVGSHRLVYGAGGYTPASTTRTIPVLEYLRNSDLADVEKANVLGENIRRVFGR